MFPFIWILNVFYWFKERTKDSGLLVSIEVSGLGLNFAIRVSVSFRVLFRVIFFLKFISRLVNFFEAGGWLEHLVFGESFLEVLIFNQKQLAIGVNVLVFDLSCRKRVDCTEVGFIELSISWWICVDATSLSLWFSCFIFGI